MMKLIYAAHTDIKAGDSYDIGTPSFDLYTAVKAAKNDLLGLTERERSTRTNYVTGHLAEVSEDMSAPEAYRAWYDGILEENGFLPDPDFYQEIGEGETDFRTIYVARSCDRFGAVDLAASSLRSDAVYTAKLAYDRLSEAERAETSVTVLTYSVPCSADQSDDAAYRAWYDSLFDFPKAIYTQCDRR